jgi:hypothetical protein
MICIRIIAILAVSVLIPWNIRGASVKSQNQKVILNLNNGIFSVEGLAANLKAKGKFYLYEGKAKKYLTLSSPQIAQEGQNITIKYSTPQVNWNLSLIPKAEMILISSTLENKTASDLWLEPGMSIQLDDARSIKHGWDGWGTDEKFGRKTISHKGIKGPVEKHVGASSRPFPAVAVFSPDKAFFVGGIPFEPVSYEAASISPLKNGKSTLKYSIRTAILPKKITSVKFVIGATNAKFGGKEAVVQSYYDSFPELWTPAVGKDNPFLWGQHGQYINWWGKPDYEKTRRLYIVNEWTYCPYKRSGDIACRPELWDYKHKGKAKPPMVFQKRIKYDNLSRAEFLAFRKKIFREYGQKFGLMFYLTVAGTWCEIQLAQQNYPDSIVKDKDVKCYLQHWSVPHDHEVRVFPMGTSFAKVLHEDIKYLVKDLKLPGFAFDCSYSGAFYRGPAVKKDLPGRAWDSRGVFIDQGVAINNLVDFIHSLKPTSDNEKKLFIFANGYLKGDYLMMEKPFLGIGTYKRWFPLLKYYIGPRPTTTHGHGYLLKETIPNWREKTTADFKQFMPKLADYIIFNCFKYATFPTSHTICYGVPQVVYIMPELIEMSRAGWQAETPLEFDAQGKKIYSARYGKGIDSYFFLGNPYPQDIAVKVKAKCDYLGDKTCLLVRKMRKSSETALSVSKQDVTLDVNLKSRIPYLYETVCGITPVNVKYECKISSEKYLNKQTYILKFNPDKNFTAQLFFRELRNFKLNSVSVNGKKLHEGIKTADVKISQDTSISIEYVSNQFDITEKQLLAFPFVDSRKRVSFKVAIPQNPTKAELDAADMLKQYFAFCAKKYVIDGKSPQVEIVQTDTIPETGNWISLSSNGNGLVNIQGNTLFIKGKDLKQLVKATEYVMDRRFHYAFPFRGSMGLYNDQLKHFKMWGKSLPYIKYFETSARGRK